MVTIYFHHVEKTVAFYRLNSTGFRKTWRRVNDNRMFETENVSNDWALVATVSRLAEASGKNRGSFSLNLSVVTAVTVGPPEASLPVSTVEKFNGGVIQLLPLHASHWANRLVITVVSLSK